MKQGQPSYLGKALSSVAPRELKLISTKFSWGSIACFRLKQDQKARTNKISEQVLWSS